MLGDQQNMRAYVYCTFTCGCTSTKRADELRTRAGKPVDVLKLDRRKVRCEKHGAPVLEPHGLVVGWATGPRQGEGVQ